MSALLRNRELLLLVLFAFGSYGAVAAFGHVEGAAQFGFSSVLAIVLGSFLFSLLIAVVAVIAGVGGGVIFTPIMLGFTSVDTLVVRATGLVVAMFSGLVSSGPFMRSGLADIRIVYYCAVPIIVGAVLGAIGAVALSEHLGEEGDAVVRLLLGMILVGIAALFIVGGANTEYPRPKKIDRFSRWLGLGGSYWEASLGRNVSFEVTQALPGALLFLLVGFTGGFFGLGGGWAVVPVLNLLMAVPLKVSAACSGVLLAVGNAAAIWPYILTGALLPLFAVPWMLGQVIGGILGAHILAGIRAAFVRNLLIVMILLTSLKLLSRGFEGLTGWNIPLL